MNEIRQIKRPYSESVLERALSDLNLHMHALDREPDVQKSKEHLLAISSTAIIALERLNADSDQPADEKSARVDRVLADLSYILNSMALNKITKLAQIGEKIDGLRSKVFEDAKTRISDLTQSFLPHEIELDLAKRFRARAETLKDNPTTHQVASVLVAMADEMEKTATRRLG